MDERVEWVLGWMLLVALLVVVVAVCLMPPRYSDGREAEAVARRMYEGGE